MFLTYHHQIRLVDLKLYHALAGLLNFLLITVTFLLSLYSGWAQSNLHWTMWYVSAACISASALVVMTHITAAYMPASGRAGGYTAARSWLDIRLCIGAIHCYTVIVNFCVLNYWPDFLLSYFFVWKCKETFIHLVVFCVWKWKNCIKKLQYLLFLIYLSNEYWIKKCDNTDWMIVGVIKTY